MRRSRRRLVLEAVCSGLCTSVEALQQLYDLTLYGALQSLEKEVASLASDHYIHQQLASVEGSQLGRATLSSSLSPEIALYVYRDLKIAMQALCLDSELHMLYLVTPFNNTAIWSNYLNWDRFHSLWLKLSTECKRIAKTIGVQERFILMRARGTYVDPENPILQVHMRFLSTLALQELIAERPLDEVAQQFGIARGHLQSLQQQAATYACMVVAFCDRLGWVYLKTLLDGFAERLAFGVRKDLTELVRIDGIDATRARAFHSAGINSASALVLADPQQIISILRRSVPYSGTCSHGKNTWLAGEPAMSESQAVGELVARARAQIAENLRLMGLFSESMIDDIVAKKSQEKEVKEEEISTSNSSSEKEESVEGNDALEVSRILEEINFSETCEQLDISCQPTTSIKSETHNSQDSGQPQHEELVDDSFFIDDCGLFSQLKVKSETPEFSKENEESDVRIKVEAQEEIGKDQEPETQIPLDSEQSEEIDSFLVDDCGLFSQLKAQREAPDSSKELKIEINGPDLKQREEIPEKDEQLDSFWVDDAGLFSPLRTANKAQTQISPDSEQENQKEEVIDSFLVDDCGLFSQLKVKSETPDSNKENEELELSRILEEVSFCEETEVPRKNSTPSLKRLAVENSRRLTLNANISLLDSSTVSSMGFDRSADLFSSPSPDVRQTKKRTRNSILASPTVTPSCRSPFPKLAKAETPRRIRNNFEIEDVCQSMQTWRKFTSEALKWPLVGVTVCFAERDRSLVGMSFCSSEGTPKFLTLADSAICGNVEEEEQYPSATPLESIGIREKIRFVFDMIESEKPKYFCDFLLIMRAIRALNVFAIGSTAPTVRNCICLKTIAFMQQIPPHPRGGALWNLAMQYDWPSQLHLDRLQSSGTRIRSAVLSYIAARMFAKVEGLLRRTTSQKSLDLELKSVELIAEMEWNGFRMNRRECDSMTAAVLKEMAALEEEGARLAGCRFSFDTPRRIAEILFVKLGVPAPPGSNGKTHFATNAAVLQQIQHPLAKVILRWRKLQNALTCSLRTLQHMIGIDGSIHTCFDHLTATGRVISSNPNVQNVPKDDALVRGKSIRSLFTAGEGMTLLAADFSQLELRVLAHLSEDGNLREILNKPTGDVFESMCAKWNADPKVQTPVDRQKAKQLCYAMIYGMGTTTLSEELKVNRKEAQDLMDSFFRQFPKVRTWIDSRVRLCRERGFVDTMLGRRRPLSDIASGIQKDRAKAERQAVNSTIQGTASEIFKMSLLKIREQLKALKGRIVMQIHDEVIVEVPLALKSEAARIVRQCMESSCSSFSVRLPVKIAAGSDWGCLVKV